MRSATLLLLLLLGLAACAAARRHKGPWFCHGRSCPHFKTLEDEGDYTKRCYARTTWAISCALDECMPEGILKARARVLEYVTENHLWGATPFASLVHLSLENAAAWNASALAATASADFAADAAADLDAAAELALDTATEQALECGLHKLVCFSYYLPEKFQGTAPAGNEASCWEIVGGLDRRPPRPRRDSGVKVLRLRRGFEAFVAGFGGFATPPRFVFEAMKLSHRLRWHGEAYDWTTAILLDYNPPSRVTNCWNEVLFPAKRWHQMLLEEGEDVFAGEEEAVAAT